MRLTKRDGGGNAVMDCDNCEIKYREGCCSKQLCRNALINKLAAYEDAEEQGRLVTLNTAPQDKYGGLKRKYIVFKSDTGEPVDGSFVLRPDRDAAARIALEAYARATENKKLADDIIRWIGDSGKTVVLPCKVGDTVWFYLYEDRYYLREGIYRGTITELKSVQRLNQSPLVLAVVEYEYPDPWYGEEMSKGEMHCSFGAYGTWVRFYLTREEAEAALKGETEDGTA